MERIMNIIKNKWFGFIVSLGLSAGFLMFTLGATSMEFSVNNIPTLSTTPTPMPKSPAVTKKVGCSMPNPPAPQQVKKSKELNPENMRITAESLDWDCDGINDFVDNCRNVFNPDQRDRNKNGVGDSCEPKKRRTRK